MKKLLLLALLATPAFAQVVADTPFGIAVAHDGMVDLIDAKTRAKVWSAEGVDYAGAIVAGEKRIAILDPLANAARIVELETGRATRVRTSETPVGGAFVGDRLYVLARDANVVERIGGEKVEVAADSAFLRVAKGHLYVYSRVGGALQKIALDPLRVVQTAQAAPFASDLEVDGTHAFLVYPAESLVRQFVLETLEEVEKVKVGAVPVDAEIAAKPDLLTATVIAVADPSSKRVWLAEGPQSELAAFTRAFLRGVAGLGLFGTRNEEFPTGIDRVMARGGRRVAYDTSSGTLYRLTDRGGELIAKGIGPAAFAVTPGAIVYWDGALRFAD